LSDFETQSYAMGTPVRLQRQVPGYLRFGPIRPCAAEWLASHPRHSRRPEPSNRQPDAAIERRAMAYDWVSKSDKTNSAHIILQTGIAKISLASRRSPVRTGSQLSNSPLIAVLDNTCTTTTLFWPVSMIGPSAARRHSPLIPAGNYSGTIQPKPSAPGRLRRQDVRRPPCHHV